MTVPDGTENEAPSGGPPTGGEFKPITSQEELNRLLGSRLERERAKFGDYDAIKAKAAQFDQLQAANKTEAEKTAEQLTELQRQVDASNASALRSRIQAKHGISDEDATLFLTGADEATLTRQAERLAEHTAATKKQGNRAPLQGRRPPSDGGDVMREFTRDLFGRQN